MNKIVKIVLVVLGALSAILWYQLPGRDVPASEAVGSGAMNFMFIITYILLAIAVAVSLLFTLKSLFANPQSLKKTLMVIGGFIVVVIISYVLASGTDVSIEEMEYVIEEANMKIFDMDFKARKKLYENMSNGCEIDYEIPTHLRKKKRIDIF